MSEFDFEELDKAVNQLMSKTDTNQTQTETAVPVTNTSSVPSPAPVALPKADQVITPAPIAAVQPPAQPLVSPRGQFMDVKPHTETNNSVSMMPTRHEPAVIASPGLLDQASIKQGPLVQDILPPDVKPQGVSSQPATAPIDQSSNIDQSTAGTEPPDPLEATTPEGLQPLAEQSSTEPSKPPEFKPDFPLFVPDAKVEKRPLGGAPNQDLDSKTNPSAVGEATMPSSEGTPHDLPAEFGHDILSIESKDTTAATIDTSKPKPDTMSPEPSDPVTAPTMAVSITQQYKETPSSGDESHTALYETASYTPLQHPAKKKSGWFVVATIIVLLLICGAVAAALYYLHIL